MYPIVNEIFIVCLTDFSMHVSEVASQLFAPPTSEISPANFTEGNASQAVCTSAKVSDISGKTKTLVVTEGKELARLLSVESRTRVGADRKNTGKRQKREAISFECLEGQRVRGDVKEAEIDSEEETDVEEEHHMPLTLPSSSSTTMSNSKESGEQAGGQGDADDEVEEISEGVKLPIFKSYDPRFVSPQEAPNSRAACEKAVNSPIEANQVLAKENHAVEEDRVDSTPTQIPLLTMVSMALELEVEVEETGSECLLGRSNLEKTIGKKKGKKSTKSPVTERVVVEDEGEESDGDAPEKELVRKKAKTTLKEKQVEEGDGDEDEKELERRKGKEKLKEKTVEGRNADEAENEIERGAKSRKRRKSKEVENEVEAVNEFEKGSGVAPCKSRVKTRAQLQAETCGLQGQVDSGKKRKGT